MGFIFLEKSKIKTAWNRKKKISANSFQRILIFHICVSSENAQFFAQSFLKGLPLFGLYDPSPTGKIERIYIFKSERIS